MMILTERTEIWRAIRDELTGSHRCAIVYRDEHGRLIVVLGEDFDRWEIQEELTKRGVGYAQINQ
jgi:nitrate reductase NapAB chaperone NapD